MQHNKILIPQQVKSGQTKINTTAYDSKESYRHPISKETECLVNQCQIRHVNASHEGTREKLRET